MFFGGRKFRKWKEQNPEGMYEAFRLAQGSSVEMERILNDITKSECRKQVKGFIKESQKLGILN